MRNLDKKIIIGAVVVAVLVLLGVFYYVGANSAPIYSSPNSPVMYFYQDDCPHCIAMHPIMLDLGAQGYRVKLMDAQTNPAYWSQYNIVGTPTWVAANGDRLIGEQSEAALQAWLNAHGAKIA